MWYLKVSSSLYIAVALICMIQNAISLTVDQTTEDQWSKLESSIDQIDLKKILKLCKNSINSFNEKLENTKTIVNKKLPEPNKTTEDIEKLVSDVKTQIKNSSADLVTVRKLVQKTALRFRDTFKSLSSFTELDNESVNKELEVIKKTTVDGKKPLVNRVVRSFGNRYDLNKLANRVLEISADREKLKNNYDEKKKIAKKELNSLWNSLTNHSKTVNDNALKAFETFFEGMKSLKSVKKKVKTNGEDAINEIKKGNDLYNLKNAVELAKALKLKFEDEWNLDSGELTYSEEQKNDTTKTMDENLVEDNEYDNSTNDIEPSLPTTEQDTIDNEKINIIPSTKNEIEKPSKDDSLTSDKTVSEVEETQLPTESENKVQTTKLQPTIKYDLPDDNISDNINSPIEETSIIPNTENKENKEKSKIINKKTSREKIPILPWQKLIQLDDTQVSQQSKKCESLLNNIIPDFDNIKKSAKNSIQVTKNYKTLQKIENETVQQFYDKMVDTNTKLSNYLVNSAEDVCDKVTPINKRYETKFKNDPNIKRIKYLLGKQYDPNQYILKVLDDASHKIGIGGMKKTTYYKMLAVAHNLNHETKEMEDAAIYAMNKIYEGKLAATNLQKMFNKEKASKACYIRNILLERENDAEKKNKDENKEKIKESINNDTNTEPLKPDVNLDSVDDIQPSTINDDNEPTLNNEEENKTINDTNESTTHNNLGDNENDNTTDEKENTKKENEEQKTEENYNISSIPQNKDSDSTTQTTNDGANKPKRNITRKVTHHRKHRNPNDTNDVSEEYDTIEEIDNEEDVTNEYKLSEDKSNDIPEAESLVNSDNKQEVSEPEQSENKNGEQKTEENYNISSIPQNKDSDSTTQTTNDGANKPKRNITRKVTHHRKNRNPNDPNDVSEEYDTIEEIDDEEDVTNEYKSSEDKSNDTPEAESLVNSDNKQEVSEPEESEKENGESNKERSSREETTEEGEPDELKTNQRLKRIDPKDGKEISEEYEEEDGNDTEKSESPFTTDNQDDAEAPGRLESENVESNEENSTPTDTSEAGNSRKSKTKLRRKRIDPKDGKKLSAENDTFEENENNLSNSIEKKTSDTPGIEPALNEETNSEQETEEEDTNTDITSVNEDTTKDNLSKESKAFDENDEKIDHETEDLNENVNLNSVEDAELKRVNNEKIIPVAESMGEDSRSYESSYESPEQSQLDTSHNWSDNNESTNINKSNKNEGIEEQVSSEMPNVMKQQNNKIDQYNKNPRRLKSEEHDTPEAPEEESKFKENKIDTPSATREYIENEQNSEIPEHDENSEDNQSFEHEPESPTNEVTAKPSDIGEQDEGNNQPNRRHRRRRDPKTGVEVSEEYDTVEEQDDESPLEDHKIDTPEYDENSEDNHLNEHEPETPTDEVAAKPSDIGEQDEGNNQPKRRHRRRRDPRTGVEVSEEYDTIEEQDEELPLEDNKIDTPEYDENSEDNRLYKHESGSPITEVAAKPSDNGEQDEGNNQPKRRHRRRRDPKTGLEVSEEYDTIEEQDEESPLEDNQIHTPEYDENSEDNQLYKHQPETPTNEVSYKPSDIGEQDEGNNLPKRRHRRRRDPKTGVEVSEEYDTIEEQDEESPLEDNKIDTPEYDENSEDNQSYEHEPESPTNEVTAKPSDIGEQDEGNNQPKRRHRRRRDPKTGVEVSEEYDTVEEQDDESPLEDHKIDTPEYDENSEDNHLYEHEPETPTDEVAAKPSDIGEQDEGNNQPKRRHRRRRDPQTGVEVSEEYDTIEEQDEELPLEDNKIDTPEYDENSEDNRLYKHESESPITEVAAKPSDNGEQDEGNNQPKRRHRRRRDPKTGLEVSEEYDTLEEQDEETPLEDNKINTPEYDENSEDNQLYKHQPETPTNEVSYKPSDIGEQDEGNNQPKRRHRRRRDPRTGVEVSEEYDTIEEQDEETPLEDNKIDTPVYDDNSEDNQSYEHEPETPTDEVAAKPSDIGEQDEGNNQPKRRHRRRRDPRTGVEVSEEYDTIEEQDEESPLEDNKINTPVNDENSEDNQLYKHQPETPTNEVSYKPSDIGEQDEGNNQPKRRHRRRRDPKTGVEVSEEYDTIEEQDEETPLEDNKIDTPVYDDNSEDNQSYEHEPETPTDEVAAKPSDIGEQDEGNNQPKRRHRRRRDPKTGLEVSEEYDTLEEQDEETPLEDNKIDTPEYDENSEDNQSYEHEPESPTNEVTAKPSDIGEQDEGNNQPKRRHRRRRDPQTGVEVSEEYDTIEEQDEESPLEDNQIHTPEYDENSEDNQLYKHQPETPTNEVAYKPSDIGEQDEGNNLPKRHHRRRRDPKTGVEVSEEYDTIEEQDEESPLEDNKIDTPEYDENSEDNQSYEHEPESPTNEVTAKPSDIGEQDEGNNQPKRRHRRRRDPRTGVEVSEEYDTIEEQDEESPLEDNKINTPVNDENSEDNQLYKHQPETPTNEVSYKPSDIGEQDEGNNQPKRRHRRRRDPKTGVEVSEEYDTIEEQDEESPLEDNKIDTPVYDENSEDNQSYEHEPETPTDEVAAKPSDIGEQDEGNNQPKRRHRRRRDPKTGLEVSEEYDTLEEQDEETPLEDNKIDTPEYDENSEDNQSYEHEPESPTNEVTAKPSDIGEQDEGNNQPKRRHRRRRDPKTGVEVSEEYDTIEEQDEESPLEDNKIDTPEYDENSEDNQSYEHEPESPTNEVTAKPSDIGEQDEGNNQPKRRHRRRRDPRTGVEVSEEYDTIEEQDEESPLEDNKINTPVNDENSEDNQLYKHQPETPTDEVAAKPSDIGEQDEGNNQPKRRHRRRRDPKTGLEVSEEYDTIEEQDEESPLEDNQIHTPEYDENSEDNQLYKHQPETPTNDVAYKPSDIGEQDEGNNLPKRHHRRRRDPKTGVEVSEEYDTIEEQDEESPLEDNKIDTPVYDENSEDNQSNDVDNNSDQPELSEYPELSASPSKDSSTPTEANENETVVNPHPRKIRRRKKSKQPQSFNGNDKSPIEVNNENINNYPVENQDVNNNYVPYNNDNVLEEDPHNGYGETNDENQPELSEYPENSDLLSKDSATPIDTDDNENVVNPHPRKIRRRKKSKQPQSFNGNDKAPIEVNNENINNYPVENQDVNNNYVPYNNDDVLEEDPHNGYGETNDENQPELSDYPENSDLLSKDSATPIDTDDNENVVNPHPRKIRRRKKSKQPQSFNGNDKAPIEVNNENINNYPVENQDVNNNYVPYNNDNVLEEDPHNGYGETNDENQPELSDYPENSDLLSKDSATPIDTDDNENVVNPHPRKIRRRKKSKQPQSFNGNDKAPIEVNNGNINNYPVENQDVNNNYVSYNNDDVLEEDPHNGYGETNDENQPELSEYPENSDLLSKDSATPIDTDDNENVLNPHPRKIRRRKKSKQPQSFNGNDKTPIETNDVSTKIIPTNIDAENSRVPNEEKSTETPEIDPNNIQKNPNKKRHVRRIIRTYVVNKATNERIPIIDQTYSTIDGFPDDINNKLDSLESDDSNVNDPDANTDNDYYSSFLFKEYNSNQCKRDGYDRFKKVTSKDAKQIAYQSILDTSEMRSNMLATLKNAIGNVKASRTFNDVDQSLRTVSYSLKVGLKQTVSDLVVKVIPLATDFLKTAKNLKQLYQRGPQSTHKMLKNILENKTTVPESAKDILRLISPQFDVDELINNIFEKPCTAKSLKDKKVKSQRKLIDLSMHMDTAISNINCFVLSAISTVGIGADTLKLLKSGKVIMSVKHPRAKILRDAVGIIEAGKKIRNNIDSFTPTLTPSDGTTESDEDDDEEDPDQVAQKNEEFLKTVPDLDDNIPIPKKVPNKRQSLGVIVVHPDKQIEYKEVTDTSQLKKFVRDQTKKYKWQSKNKHPKFLKLNSKQLIDAMVADVKKKAERNGMTKKEMVDEIIKNLGSS